jgi:hypothetical protein
MPAAAPTWPPHGIVSTGYMIRSFRGFPARQRPANCRPLEFSEIGQARMEARSGSGAGRDRRLLLAVILGLGLVIGGLAYEYSDDLTALAQSFSGGKLGRPQGRFHY